MPASARWVREGILAKYAAPAKVNGKSAAKSKTAVTRVKAAKAVPAKKTTVKMVKKITSKTGKPLAKKTSKK